MKKQIPSINPSIELLATERALQSVTACNRVLVRAKSELEMLSDICRTIIKQAGYRMAWIGYPEADEKQSLRVVACAGFEDGYLNKANITVREDDVRGQGPTGVAYRTGEIVVCNNFQTDPSTGPWREEAKARGYNSSISMPLKHTNECFGVMMIYAEQIEAFQDRERQLLAGLADDIAYGIHNLRITQLHHDSEAALQANEARYHELVDNLDAGVVVHAPDTSVIMSNSRALELLGLSEEQIKGRLAMDPEWKFLHEDHTPLTLEEYPVHKVVSGKKAIEDSCIGIVRPGRKGIVWVNVNGGPVFDQNGEIREVIISFVDITKRKQTEEAAQKFSERLQIATRAARIGIWEWNVVDDVQIWDDTICEIYGVPHGSFNGGVMKWSEHLHPDDLGRVNDDLQAALRAEREYAPEFRVIWPDGTIRNIKANSQTFFDQNGKPIRMVGTNIDITEHRQVQAEKARLLAIIEESQDFIGIADMQGNLLYQNRASMEMVGLPGNASLAGMTIRNMQPDWAAKRVIEEGIPTVLKEGFWNAETAILHRNGTEIPVSQTVVVHRDASGQPQFLSTIMRDITERRQMEQKILALNVDLERRVEERTQELAETEARMRFALEASRIGAWDLNLKTHTAFRSLELDRVFGYDELQPEWTFEQYLEHVLPEDRALVESKFRKASASRSEFDFECRIRRADGKIRWIWAIGRYTLIDDKDFRHITGIVQDITERKLAELEIAQLNQGLTLRGAELETANQELEAFSYSVSHDLRAPLRAIDGFSRILLEDYSDKLDGQAQENLLRVRSASQRMGLLIDDLLQLSRYSRSVLRRVPVDLSALTRVVAEDLKTQAPERRVEFVIAPDLRVVADPGLMQVMLVNLLGNAWKFTSKTAAARIELGCMTVDGAPAFFVRDNGAGFDMSYADKLFGVFQRLHSTSEFPGTGIGLTIIQRIIHRHGGRVWAEGQVNHGATFYFTLPDPALLKPQPKDQNHENESQSAGAEKGRIRP